MKIFKQLSTVLFLVIFLIGVNSIKAQEVSKNKELLSFNSIMNTSNLSYDSNAPYVYETYYFEKINSTITFTLENDRKKLVAIDDPSNYFSDAFLAQVIINSNSTKTSLVADNCGCGWWQILCRAYCALNEGLDNQQ